MTSSLLLCITLLLGPQRAEAQGSQAVATARAQFARGVAAAERGDWPAARDAFARSYRIAPRVMTLFNLAGAQVQTGDLVAASESYRAFLADARERRYAAHRRAAERALSALTPRLARLRLNVTNLAGDDRVQLDDHPIVRAALDVPMPVDPGAHVVTVVRGDEEIAREELSLAEGESVERRIALPVPTPEPAAVVAEENVEPVRVPALPDREDEDGGGLLSSPWFWIATVVVLGGAFAVTWIATHPSDPTPTQGTLGPVIVLR